MNKMAKRKRLEGEKFQGREITATIQAPTKEQLEMMLRELGDYTMEVGLEPIKILSQGPDPDGGYRAVVVAHNFNPLAWLKKKWEERGGGYEARAAKKQKKEEERLAELEKQATRRASEARSAKKLTPRRLAALKKKAAAEEALAEKRRAELRESQAEMQARQSREVTERELVRYRMATTVAPAPIGYYRLTEKGRAESEQDNTGVSSFLVSGPVHTSELGRQLRMDDLTVRRIIAILVSQGLAVSELHVRTEPSYELDIKIL